jgi:putative ABC transport system permease protein
MRTLRAFCFRLLGFFRSRGADDDFAAELESHIALHTDAGIRSGLTAEEARRQALIHLGGVEQTQQAQRERRGLPWLDSLLQDTQYGVRTLRRSPGFTITAVSTLALGIGACTAIFSLVNAVLLRSLPYGDPDRMVYLFTPNPHIAVPPDVMTPSYADFYDIERESHSFARMSVFEQAMFNVAIGDSVERLSAAKVDEKFFETLESAPLIGRAIGRDDNVPGHSRVAVISDSLWQSMFGGSTDILNRSLSLEGARYRIVGVMPPAFLYPSSSDLPYGNPGIKATHIWIPLALTAKQKAEREPGSDEAIARLRPGVSVREAQAEMGGIMKRLDQLHSGGELGKGWGALVKNFMDNAVGPVRPLMWLLLGAVVLVLLIACGNAANLLLARAANRMRELGTRAALGAGRWRIVRQLLTESLLIGVAAGLIGIGLAYAFLHLLLRLDPGDIPRLKEASLDTRVLFFTVGASLLTSVLAGILPALTVVRMSLTDFLTSGGGGRGTGAHSRSQSVLIVVEAALVVVLLAGAGLFIRSYLNVESVTTGFSLSTVTMNMALDERYGTPQQQSAFFKNLIGKIGALPGIDAAGAINYLPLTHSESLGYFWVNGFANQKDQMAEGRSVTPQYFRAMNIPLLAGRFFAEDEVSIPVRPTIVNEQFANKYFAGRNPIGGQVRGSEKDPWSTIVGVVADVRHLTLEEAPQPQMYSPDYEFGSAYIAVRSARPPSAVASEIRATLKGIDPNLARSEVHTMGDLMSEATARRRFQTSLLSVFAAIALLLALVGLYGLMTYSVNSRTRELGIRMALGAQRTDVTLLVLRQAGFLLGLGLACGLLCTWIATRAVKAFLFGVQAHDPTTILLVCVLLAVCGFVAALIPARRAASIDPMQALRTE